MLSPAGSDRAWLLGATGAQFTPMPFKSFLIRIKKKVPIGDFLFYGCGGRILLHDTELLANSV